MSGLASGIAWNVATNVASRAAAFGSQIVLGAALSKENYAVYGIALSLSALVSALRGGGTQQVLIQRGNEYEELAPIVTYVSFIFNVVSSLFLILVGWWWARANNLPQLNQVIILMAIAGIITTQGLVMQAKLAVDQKFKQLSLVSGIAGVGRHALAMLLAAAGMGVLCFSVPIVAESSLILMVSYAYVRRLPRLKRPTYIQFKQLFRDTKWLMISGFAVSMVLYGQFILVGLYVNKNSLGTFVFSMQLIQSVAILMVLGINDVIFPRMAKISKSENADSYYLNCLETGVLISLLLAVAVIITTSPILSFIWGTKWHDAALPVQILSALIPTTSACTILCAALAAKGLWRQRTSLLFLYLLTDLAAIYLFGKSRDLIVICEGLVIMRLVASLFGAYFLFGRNQRTFLPKVLNIYFYMGLYLSLLVWVSWSGSHDKPIEIGLLIPTSFLLIIFLSFRVHFIVKRTL